MHVRLWLAPLHGCSEHNLVKLSDLTPRELDLLERAAQQELDRRGRRRPIGAVRQLLRAAAEEAGYTVAAVFPEFASGRRAPARGTPRSAPPTKAARVPKAPKTGLAPVPQLDPAQQLVRALAAGDPKGAGLSQSLDAVRASMGLSDNWPAFHAATETAARRNWLHFRGNDHCVLTPDGLAESQR